MELKRILIITFGLIFILCSCGENADNTSLNPETEKDARVTEEAQSEEQSTMQSAIRNDNFSERYGKKDENVATLTGLSPLSKIEFKVDDPENTRMLSNEKICHSFGVAADEKAHEISVSSQKYFDEKGFKALTLDTKSDKKVVYLTFDVGYDNGYTEMILDTLKEKNVTAAFFCTVDEMKSDPQSIARMINEGHIVGNHTNSHPSMDELTRTEMMNEIKGFDDYIRENFGYTSPYFRFPKGEYSDNALDLVGSLGYTSVFWSLAYSDWDTENQKGEQYALNTVVSRIHPGAVILLHAVSSDNAHALGKIIDTIRGMGYEFLSLDDYRQ